MHQCIIPLKRQRLVCWTRCFVSITGHQSWSHYKPVTTAESFDAGMDLDCTFSHWRQKPDAVGCLLFCLGIIVVQQKHHYGRIWLWCFTVVWVTRCVMVCIVLHSLRGPKRRQWRFWPTMTTAERCTPSQVSICRLVRKRWLQIGHWHTDHMMSLMGHIHSISVFNGAFLSGKALGFWFLKRSILELTMS